MRAEVRWIPLKEWDANGGMLTDRDKLKGARAWGGLDLSSVSDLTAWLLVAESPQPDVDLEIFPRFYLPSTASKTSSGSYRCRCVSGPTKAS
jgi:phage terminase large subunit-like protein